MTNGRMSSRRSEKRKALSKSKRLANGAGLFCFPVSHPRARGKYGCANLRMLISARHTRARGMKASARWWRRRLPICNPAHVPTWGQLA